MCIRDSPHCAYAFSFVRQQIQCHREDSRRWQQVLLLQCCFCRSEISKVPYGSMREYRLYFGCCLVACSNIKTERNVKLQWILPVAYVTCFFVSAQCSFDKLLSPLVACSHYFQHSLLWSVSDSKVMFSSNAGCLGSMDVNITVCYDADMLCLLKCDRPGSKLD